MEYTVRIYKVTKAYEVTIKAKGYGDARAKAEKMKHADLTEIESDRDFIYESVRIDD